VHPDAGTETARLDALAAEARAALTRWCPSAVPEIESIDREDALARLVAARLEEAQDSIPIQGEVARLWARFGIRIDDDVSGFSSWLGVTLLSLVLGPLAGLVAAAVVALVVSPLAAFTRMTLDAVVRVGVVAGVVVCLAYVVSPTIEYLQLRRRNAMRRALRDELSTWQARAAEGRIVAP
jgi:hypothetical protein